MLTMNQKLKNHKQIHQTSLKFNKNQKKKKKKSACGMLSPLVFLVKSQICHKMHLNQRNLDLSP